MLNKRKKNNQKNDAAKTPGEATKKDMVESEGSFNLIDKLASFLSKPVASYMHDPLKTTEKAMDGHQTNLENLGEKLKDPTNSEEENQTLIKAMQEEGEKKDELNADFQEKNDERLFNIPDLLQKVVDMMFKAAVVLFIIRGSNDKGDDSSDHDDSEDGGGEE